MRAITFALISILAGSFSIAKDHIAAPEQKPVEDLLAKMRKAYSSAKSVALEVKVRNNTQNGVASGRFSFKYQHPNRIRYLADIGSNHVERYCDGKEVVTIFNAQRNSTKTINVDTLGGRMPGNLEWLCFFDWKRQLSTSAGNNMAQSKLKVIPSQTWNGKKWIVLEESAPQVGVGVRYFVDPKTYFIWRCDVSSIDQKRQITRTEVTKLDLNVKFESKLFTPPSP
jgi:outer membrane lipoprotein-sorting protein